MQHFSNSSSQSNQQRSPISQSSQGFGPQPMNQPMLQRFQDYSPLQSVNLSKYNFDYERANHPQQMSSNDGGSKNTSMMFNEPSFMMPGSQTQTHRHRDALSNESLRINRQQSLPSQYGEGYQHEINKLQLQQNFGPMISQPAQQNLTSHNAQNSFLQQLQQQQMLSQSQVMDTGQVNPQYLQLILQQQQQLQLMQSLLNQSASLQQQKTVNPQNSISDLQRVMRMQAPSSMGTIQQSSLPNQIPQQFLFQQLLSQSSSPAFSVPQSEKSSVLPTPMESTRNLPQVSLLSQVPMMQPPQPPSQHQQFVQSYQQIQENLNQYRKLANFLEQMEANKRTTKADMDQSKLHTNSDRSNLNEEESTLQQQLMPNQQKQTILWPSRQDNLGENHRQSFDGQLLQQQNSYVLDLEQDSKFVEMERSQHNIDPHVDQQITKESFNESTSKDLPLNETSHQEGGDLKSTSNNMSQQSLKSLRNSEEKKRPLEEKHIIGCQKTFEQMLEEQLRYQPTPPKEEKEERKKSQKKDFLRKNSTNRGVQIATSEKPAKQYKYYADNFQNNSKGASLLQSSQSPKSILPQSLKRSQNAEQSSSSGKKSHTKSQQKSNQKQPKQNHTIGQRNSPNAHQMRPQSQQVVHQERSSPPVNRSNLTSVSFDQEINFSEQKKHNAHEQSIQPALPQEPRHEEDPQNLLSERNSVAEFEMLEQECMTKYLQNSKDEDPLQSTSEQKQQLDAKIAELEVEIERFKLEKNKVTDLHREYEQQLGRVTSELDEFEERKAAELEEIQQWKQEQLDEIEGERQALESEKARLEEERKALVVEKGKHERLLVDETERLLEKIKELEHDNAELNRKLDELTDKQYHCAGTQTTSLPCQDECVNTILEEEPPNELTSQSPLRGILKNNCTAKPQQDEKFQNMTFNSSHQSSNNEGISHYQKPASDSPRVEDEDSLEEEVTEKLESQDADIQEGSEDEEDEFDLKFPAEYHGKHLKPAKKVDEIVSHDGKVQRFFDNGKKEVVFSNGVRREAWPNGYSIVYFTNNDVKQTFPDQKVVYYFADARTTQTTFPNGLQVFKFSNNQVEKHFQDGTKEISFPDGTIKCLFPDGEEESIFPDGTIQKIEKSGIRIIEFPNGQRDVMYPDGTKVREYEDGSVKKIHPDGRQEVVPASKKMPEQSNQLKKYMVSRK